MATVDHKKLYFEMPLRIYPHDTDWGGIAYHANFLRYFDQARTEWLRSIGIEQRRLSQAEGIVFVVVRADIRYARPARLDDALLVRSSVKKIDFVSIVFEQNILQGTEMVAQAMVTLACVNVAAGRAVKMPSKIRQQIVLMSQKN